MSDDDTEKQHVGAPLVGKPSPLGEVSTSTKYNETRLKEQTEWHSRKARENKLRFRQFQIITRPVA